MTQLHKRLAAFIICMLMGVLCHAQIIKGTVLDSLGKPVGYASINLKSAGLIISYTTSGEKGIYSLQVPAESAKAPLTLDVSCIGYKKAVQSVDGFNQVYNFKLSGAVHQLQTVTIKDKNPRLKVSGDTLSYKVSDFSSPQDRVIGDVIKKLPGMEVDKDGKISYNGKAISNLYIGGDNLLDDKYNIATGSIPHGVVDQVQVMENHQPIKMLKDKVVSDDVALNLTIKKDAKIQLVGQETIGAGLPGNYYAELNAMAFKDKYKAINYLKGNNIGSDVSNDLISHNASDYLARVDNDKANTLLSLGTAGDPDLPRSRYLFNKAGLANFNNLFNLKKEVQLRANISYLRDDQRQDYRKNSETYIGRDTIRVSETQRNTVRPDVLHAGVLLNINKAKYYLNNNFSADYSRNNTYSALVSNGTPVNQYFKDNLADFANNFDYMNTFKSNNIIEVASYINRSAEPENRIINPNFNSSIFNHGTNYLLLTQNADIPTWFTNNYISYKIPRTITQSYKAGFSLQSQNLVSALTVTQINSSYNLLNDSAQNNLNWKRQKFYSEAAFDYPGGKWKINVSLPLSLQYTQYSDAHFKLDDRLQRLYFNPRATFRFQSWIENYLTAGYNFRNTIGNIADVYRGTILTNYRSLVANNADLSERQSQNANVGFNYRRAITLFFFALNASYSHIYANTISSTILNSNISQRVVLPFDNKIDTWSFSGNISKYDFSLRTTFSAGANYSFTKLNQILNRLVLPYNTVSESANFGADTKVSNQVNFTYKANLLQTISKSAVDDKSNKFQRLMQSLAVYYNPTNTLFTSIAADHYYTHQPDANDLKYLFADASVRYKFGKKMDLELDVQNIFDTKNYTAVYLSANLRTSSSYTIPGRILLAKVMFNL